MRNRPQMYTDRTDKDRTCFKLIVAFSSIREIRVYLWLNIKSHEQN